mmetsp:Transcript_2032/g.6257  ORF Transcript_2032/g.6257 Transcript_2032/m.6257 type:complete len:310 (-) Transcript_2032:97-1026(-)
MHLRRAGMANCRQVGGGRDADAEPFLHGIRDMQEPAEGVHFAHRPHAGRLRPRRGGRQRSVSRAAGSASESKFEFKIKLARLLPLGRAKFNPKHAIALIVRVLALHEVLADGPSPRHAHFLVPLLLGVDLGCALLKRLDRPPVPGQDSVIDHEPKPLGRHAVQILPEVPVPAVEPKVLSVVLDRSTVALVPFHRCRGLWAAERPARLALQAASSPGAQASVWFGTMRPATDFALGVAKLLLVQPRPNLLDASLLITQLLLCGIGVLRSDACEVLLMSRIQVGPLHDLAQAGGRVVRVAPEEPCTPIKGP